MDFDLIFGPKFSSRTLALYTKAGLSAVVPKLFFKNVLLVPFVIWKLLAVPHEIVQKFSMQVILIHLKIELNYERKRAKLCLYNIKTV